MLGSIPYKFSNNPTTKAFIRDSTILLSIAIVSWQEVEIGSTGITYDWGVFTGATLMSACKITIIGSATYFYPALIAGPVGLVTLGSVSLTANFVCRPTLRIFKVASREYPEYLNTITHDQECPLPYKLFIEYNLESLLIRGIKESIPKIFVSNIIIGETLKGFFKHINSYASLASDFLVTQACLKIVQPPTVDLNGQQGMYNKAAVCFTAGASVGLFVKASFYAVLTVIEVTITTAREFCISSIFVPLSNAVADSSIPDWLFGSNSELASTAAGTTALIMCIATTSFAPPVCVAGGVTIKIATDLALSHINTTETNVIGENTPHHHDDL